MVTALGEPGGMYAWSVFSWIVLNLFTLAAVASQSLVRLNRSAVMS